MAETFQRVVKSPVTQTTFDTIYTCPAATTAIVIGMHVANVHASAASHTTVRTKDTAGRATATRARASNVATLTTGSAHGLSTGNVVTIHTLGGTGYNAESVTITVTSTTAFTYANTGSDEGSTSDTAGLVSLSTEISNLANQISVPVNDSLNPIQGKLVLEAGNVLQITSENASSLDCTLSVLEIT